MDPFGDKTKVIVTGNRMGRFEYGTHAALYFDNGPRGPFLYDPAGSYRNETRGACGCFEGEEADLEDYLKYHLQTPNEFYTVFVFDTTAEEEAELYRKIDPDNAKDPRGINCALMVSKVLSGTGPFKNLKPTRYPAHLQKELLDLLK